MTKSSGKKVLTILLTIIFIAGSVFSVSADIGDSPEPVVSEASSEPEDVSGSGSEAPSSKSASAASEGEAQPEIAGDESASTSESAAPPKRLLAPQGAGANRLNDVGTDIILLLPNLTLETGDDGKLNTGVTSTGAVLGSFTLPEGETLTDVVFTIKSDSAIVLGAPTGQGAGANTYQVLDDGHTLLVTVPQIEGVTGAGVRTYFAFDYSFPNRTTPDGQVGNVWMESIASDGVVKIPQDWSDAGYSNVMQASATAAAKNEWIYKGSAVTTQSVELFRGETDYNNGTTHEVPAPPSQYGGADSFSFDLEVRGTDGGYTFPATGYADTQALTLGVSILLGGEFGIDPALRAKLSTTSWTTVYDGSTPVLAEFAKYFGLAGSTYVDCFTVSAKIDPYDDQKILLQYESKAGSYLTDYTHVTLTIDILRYYFEEPIPPYSGQTAPLTGTITCDFNYSNGFCTYASAQGGAVGSATTEIYREHMTYFDRTMNVVLKKAESAEEKAQAAVANIAKLPLEWFYSTSTRRNNLGGSEDGDNIRYFVSSKGVTYNDGQSPHPVAMNFIWFVWNNLAGKSLPQGIGQFDITETKGTSFTSELCLSGFAIPGVAVNTAAEIWVDYGAGEVLVWQKTAGAASGSFTAAFDANLYTNNIAYSGSGTRYALITGEFKSVRYSFSADENNQITFTSNPIMLFRCNPEAITTGSTGTTFLQNTSKLSLYNYSGAVLANVNKAGQVLYKKYFNDTLSANKKATNLDKGMEGDTTAGDRIQYTVTVNGPPKDSAGSTGVVDGFWLKDTPGQWLSLPAGITAKVVVTHAGAASTVALLNNGTKTTSGLVDTYTNVVLDRAPANGLTGEELMLRFGGSFLTGDKIEIIYEGVVKGGAPVGASTVKNDVYIKAYTDGKLGTPTGWNFYAHKDLPVQPVARYGDVILQYVIMPEASGGTAVTGGVYPGDDLYFYATGGLVGADSVVENPAFLFYLPPALRATGKYQDADSRVYDSYTVPAGGSRYYGSSNRTVPAPTFTYFDEDGQVVTPTDEASWASIRYLYAVYNGVTLGKNEVLQVLFGAAVADVPSGGTIAAEAAFLGAADLSTPIALTSAGRWGYQAPIADSQAEGAVWNALLAGLTSDGTVPADYGYVQYIREIPAYENKPTVSIGKSGVGKTAYTLNEQGTFRITVTNEKIGGTTSDPKHGPQFLVEKVADVMPAGMHLVPGTAKYSLDGGTTYTPITPFVDDTVGTGVNASQRLVFDINKSIAYGKTVLIDYTAVYDDPSALASKGDSTGTATNTAVLYFDAAGAKVKNAGQDMGLVRSGPANWYSWDTANYTLGKSGLSADLPLTLALPNVLPYLTKTLHTWNLDEYGNNKFTNYGAPVVKWKLSVGQNIGTGLSNMVDFYVVEVLPQGVTVNTTLQPGDPGYLDSFMLDGTPAPNGVFVNNEGQQVLWWYFDAARLAALGQALNFGGNTVCDATGVYPGKSFDLSFSTQGNANSIGTYTNYSYLIPSDRCYFSNANVYPDDNNDLMARSFSGAPTTLPARKGRVATQQVIFVSSVGAEATKSVTVNGNTSSSSDAIIASASRGDVMDFSYLLSHTGSSQPFTDIVVVDRLPSLDDYAAFAGYARGSSFGLDMVWPGDNPAGAFTVLLNGVAVAGTDYTIYYTDDVATTMPGWLTAGTVTWTPAASWPSASVRPVAFKIAFNSSYQLPQNSNIAINWQMKMPSDLPTSAVGKLAYNTAAFYFKQNSLPFSAEPNKCSVALKGAANLNLQVQKVLDDPMQPALARDFTFLLEKQTIAGTWEAAEIPSVSNGTASTTETGVFTIAGVTPGTTGKTAVINGLNEGFYRVTEIGVSTGSLEDYTITVDPYSNPAVATQSGTVQLNTASNNAKVTVTNTVEPPETYALTVQKRLQDATASGTVPFAFLLEVQTGPNSWAAVDLAAPLVGTTGSIVIPGGAATGVFTLSAGNGAAASGTITGLLEGTYRVTEDATDAAPYIVTYSDNNAGVALSTNTPAETIAITNTRLTLNVKKVLDDVTDASPKTFTFQLQDGSGAPVDISAANIAITNGTKVPGQTGVFTISLAPGNKTATISGLPAGTYKVAELDTPAGALDEYTVSYSANNTAGVALGTTNAGGEVTVTNLRKTYGLTVQKLLQDVTQTGTKTFRFLVEKKTGVNSWAAVDLAAAGVGTTGSIVVPGGAATGVFTLAAGHGTAVSGTITGLADGTYRVTEDAADAAPYIVAYSDNNAGVALDTNHQTPSVIITNTRLALRVQKTLTDATDATSRTFTFQVQNASGVPVDISSANIAITNGTKVPGQTGVFTMNLAPGNKTATISGLPAGTYKVAELDTPAGMLNEYTVSYSANNTAGVALGTVNASGEITVTNLRKTYSLTVEKLLQDVSAAGTLPFEFQLEKQTGATSWVAVDLAGLQVAGATVTDATNGKFTLAAQNNQTVGATFTGLPNGNYRVTEVGSNTANYTVTGDNGKAVGLNASGSGTAIVGITNTRLTLRVAKVLADSTAGGAVPFEFVLERSTGSGWNPMPLNAPEIQVSGNLTLTNAAAGLFTINGLNGQTVSGSISGLPEGTYRVREVGANGAAYSVSYNMQSYVLNAVRSGLEVFTITNTKDTPPSSSSSTGGTSSSTGGTSSSTSSSSSSSSSRVTSVTSTTSAGSPSSSDPASSSPPSAPPPPSSSAPTPGAILSGGGDGTPTQMIPSIGGIPLYGAGGAAWSLLNLICATLGTLIAIVLFFSALSKRRKNAGQEDEALPEKEEGDETEAQTKYKRPFFVLRLLTMLLGLATAILFLVLEDVRLPMTWITQWSYIIVPVFVLCLIALILFNAARRKEKDEQAQVDPKASATPA